MTDVIVVGAGPTGLTLACGLQAAGVDVWVLDKASGPAVTCRALGLQPRGVEVLDRLGALGDLPDRGLPIRTVTINVDGRELASFPVGQATRLGGPRGLIMSQADIEAALRDRLIALGGDVEWGRGVSGLEPERHGVRVRLDDGSDADASWVVAADGAHSVVRKAMGIGFPGVPVVERFVLADVHADIDLKRGGATSWLRGDMMLAVFPLPGIDLWRVMAPHQRVSAMSQQQRRSWTISVRGWPPRRAERFAPWCGHRRSGSSAGWRTLTVALASCWPATPHISRAHSVGRA